MKGGLVLALIAIVALQAPARAQMQRQLPENTPAAELARVRAPVCFRGRPDCVVILLAELQLGAAWSTGSEPAGPSALTDAEAGLLVNPWCNRPHGIGLTIGDRRVSDFYRKAHVVRARYRRWLSPLAAVDLSMGWLFHVPTDDPWRGNTAQVAVTWLDQVGLFFDLDLIEGQGERPTRVEIIAGVKVGNYAALALTALGAIWFATHFPE